MKRLLGILTITAWVCSLMSPGIGQAHQSTHGGGIAPFITHIWESSPAVREVDARVAAARARGRAASRWQYNPELEYEVEHVDGEEETRLFGITQTIDWTGKFVSSGRAADLGLLAVLAERDDVRHSVAVDVLSALAGYRVAQDVYALAVQHTRVIVRFEGLAENRFKAGDIDQTEYNLARLALADSLIAEAEAETDLSDRKHALNASIGFRLDDAFPLPKLPVILPDVPTDDPQNEDALITRLAALRALKYREEAARAFVTQAKKDRFPDPSIGITGGKEAGARMVGVSVSVPLHVLNTYGAELDAAKAQAIAAAQSFQNAEHSARARLKSSRRSYDLRRTAWEAWRMTGELTLAEQIETLDRKYDVGDLSTTDYLVQIDQVLDTQLAAKDLHNKVWQSWFAWLGASGSVEEWIHTSGENQ